jgi:hypothetical protein
VYWDANSLDVAEDDLLPAISTDIHYPPYLQIGNSDVLTWVRK